MIHWDGKIVEEFLDIKQERIGVIITGGEHERNGNYLAFLAYQAAVALTKPMLFSILPRSGILRMRLLEWLFDATASNTRKHAAAAVILERRFKRKLMWITYRHRSFALVVWNVRKRLFKRRML